ncbi:hypothetical protein ILUMI_12457, partial [Ignelater luminosus]
MGQAVFAEMPESVRLPFLALSKYGLLSTNKFKAYITLAVLVLIQSNLILIAMLQFLNVNRDISDIVRNLEHILGFSMVMIRMVIVTYRNEDFRRLFETIKLFWDPCKCNQQTKMKLLAIRRFTSQLQRLLVSAALVSVLVVVSFPLLQNTIPTGIWTMKGHAMLYRFVLIEEITVVPFCAFFLGFLDCIYLGFCVEIVIQFKIVSQYLQELKVENNAVNEVEIDRLNEIKSCVRHHRIILQFIKEFQQAFSLVLLIEFVIDGPLVCAELLAAFESRSYQNQMRHVLIFTFVTFQLAFFCIPANYITNEAMAVSDAVYFSNWYSQQISSLKAPLLLIIQNSQNEIIIKGGNLVTINAGTIVN